MKILVAPDKFKGSLSSQEACAAIKLGIQDKFPDAQIIDFPLADGGNGTAEILAAASGGKMISCEVHDPLFRIIKSNFGISGDGNTAFVEMASASGLELLKVEERNCYNTSTFGTGELLVAASREKVARIILCIGGSATNDAGIGMASCLGYRFYDKSHRLLEPIGKNLEYLESIDDAEVNTSFKNIAIEVACDVNNPLAGPSGAAWVYGPQKGATREELRKLDSGLENFARLIQAKFGISIRDVPGAGAAGGLGGGAIVFLNAILKSGVDIVLKYIDFKGHLPTCQWVITGEGKLDSQSMRGKLVQGVTRVASSLKIPVLALAGKVELTPKEINAAGIHKAYSINPEGTNLEESIKNASTNLRYMAGVMAEENFRNKNL